MGAAPDFSEPPLKVSPRHAHVRSHRSAHGLPGLLQQRLHQHSHCLLTEQCNGVLKGANEQQAMPGRHC